jgi:predicted O-linked N-acetylglucosamine transferase (SPINDLY family)
MPALTVQQGFELALQHHRAGRLPQAEAVYEQVIAVAPSHARAWHYLGLIACQGGRHDLAVERIRRALVFDPDDAPAHFDLGNAFQHLGRHDDATAAYRQALFLKPDYGEAYINLANIENARRLFDEALAHYRRGLELKPNVPEAHYNFGHALQARGHFQEAIVSYRRALELQPAFPLAQNNLGNCHRSLGQFDEAITCYRQAIQYQANYAGARNNLAATLKEQGRLAEAVEEYRRSLAINPQDALVHSNLILALHFLPEQPASAIAAEQRRWNDRFADSQKFTIRPCQRDRSETRRLRIGYVSPDFFDHVVGRNLRPLFRNHDHHAFEIFAYSNSPREDSFTLEFQSHSDHWLNTASLSDDALAEVIHRDGVDILVDLTQHAGCNRLPVFARHPAPVQMSFAGYPESSGLKAIPYRISDPWLEDCRRETLDGSWEIGWKNRANSTTPPERQASPELPAKAADEVFLIDSFWCYDPCRMEVRPNELPASQNGYVTFGSLCSFFKINEPVLRLWARVLLALPGSRLTLLVSPGSHRARSAAILEREGIQSDRLQFVAPRPRRAYLELYHSVDLVLDPFPYGGHTTALDALWMGVPIVSLAGRLPVSRAGLSILGNLGLRNLVASTEEAYIEIATTLARDRPALAELRRTLRSRLENSVLMDAPRFTRNIETAYRTVWQRWCRENPEP